MKESHIQLNYHSELAMPSSPEFDVVTRSDNIGPPTVQKSPNGKPKKKGVLTKKSPAVERPSNDTTTLVAKLHSQFLSQGHSAVPIDVDKLPESKEAISPSKSQIRRSSISGTMEKTKLLDGPRQYEDRSMESNISPADLKPENKKRAIRSIEDSQGIHVVEQERPNKRTRMDMEKPSHPVLQVSYQRKKYGRTSSPRGESPISTIDYDEMHTGVIERPNPRASAMNGKRSGKKSEPKPAAPQKREQEPQDIKLVGKPTAPKVPAPLTTAEGDNQARESLSETDHNVRPLSSSPVSLVINMQFFRRQVSKKMDRWRMFNLSRIKSKFRRSKLK
jgi:hypothetical protein